MSWCGRGRTAVWGPRSHQTLDCGALGAANQAAIAAGSPVEVLVIDSISQPTSNKSIVDQHISWSRSAGS